MLRHSLPMVCITGAVKRKSVRHGAKGDARPNSDEATLRKAEGGKKGVSRRLNPGPLSSKIRETVILSTQKITSQLVIISQLELTAVKRVAYLLNCHLHMSRASRLDFPVY